MGGKKGGGKGAGQRQAKGRTMVGSDRMAGTVSEWHGQWGWVTADKAVNHPQAQQNKGRIYLHKADLLGAHSIAIGSKVDFALYCDGKGLGAADCQVAGAGGGGEGPLPEGWEKIWSDEHKEFYYWHKASKESSWTWPGPDGGDEDEHLPDGWEKHFDAKNEEFYYWHRPTKATQWERPDGTPGVKRAAAPRRAEAEARGDDGAVLGQQRVRGRVTKWQGFFGWIAPQEDLGEDLKPLLERHQDKIYVNWRDVQKGLTLDVGTAVDFLLYADDNGLGARDVKPQSKGFQAKAWQTKGYERAVAELEDEWAAQDAELAGVAGDLAEDDAAGALGVAELAPEGEDEDAEQGELLPGWEQLWSSEHGCHFYWHTATKQSSWERPCVPVPSAGGGPAGREKVWEGEGSEEGAARLATPITPFVSKPGREMTPITPAGPKAREEAARATGTASAPATPVPAAGKAAGKGAAKGGKGKAPNANVAKRAVPSWSQQLQVKRQRT